MEDFRCSYCGYNVTGIEQFAVPFDLGAYQEVDGYTAPLIGTEIFNQMGQNTIKCPQCGRTGGFTKG